MMYQVIPRICAGCSSQFVVSSLRIYVTVAGLTHSRACMPPSIQIFLYSRGFSEMLQDEDQKKKKHGIVSGGEQKENRCLLSAARVKVQNCCILSLSLSPFNLPQHLEIPALCRLSYGIEPTYTGMLGSNLSHIGIDRIQTVIIAPVHVAAIALRCLLCNCQGCRITFAFRFSLFLSHTHLCVHPAPPACLAHPVAAPHRSTIAHYR